MEDAVNVSTAKDTGDIVVAGAGYAGLHVALRLTAKLRNNPGVDLTLVDRHNYHQVLTELPRVAGGTRAADAVRIPLQDVLAKRVRFIRTEISGSTWLNGELAEMLPEVASGHGLAPDRPAVLLVEAGPTILAGSSPQLINKARRILSDLGVQVRTNAAIAAATEEGFRLKGGQLVQGGVFVWAGGVKAPELVLGSGLPTGHNGRVKVDQYLRVLDHPEVYVAGDLASVVDPRTGSPNAWEGPARPRSPSAPVVRPIGADPLSQRASNRRVRNRRNQRRRRPLHQSVVANVVLLRQRQLSTFTPLFCAAAAVDQGRFDTYRQAPWLVHLEITAARPGAPGARRCNAPSVGRESARSPQLGRTPRCQATPTAGSRLCRTGRSAR
jgi:Pyridine nucleotide-disulphide oxidoreductase